MYVTVHVSRKCILHRLLSLGHCYPQSSRDQNPARRQRQCRSHDEQHSLGWVEIRCQDVFKEEGMGWGFRGRGRSREREGDMGLSRISPQVKSTASHSHLHLSRRLLKSGKMSPSQSPGRGAQGKKGQTYQLTNMSRDKGGWKN